MVKAMAKLGTELTSVQKPLIKYAQDIGWEYLTPEEASKMKGGDSGLILKEVFSRQMKKLNLEFITDEIIEQLTKRLEKLPTRIEGNLQAWEYLKGIKPVFVPKEKRERNVKLIDENPEKNVFQITEEFTYSNGKYTNRYDVVFFINGVPLFFVEAKSAAKFFGKGLGKDSIISDALDQTERYHRETPEAMTLFQLFTVTNIIHFLYSATWNSSSKFFFNWKTETDAKDYETMVKTFFDKEKVLNALLNFILFTRQDDELTKVILRPHQMRAVKKVAERAAEKSKDRGLVWHTQGSGKTYTMIAAAQRILENPLFENPTVILLVDRNELEGQLFGKLSAVGVEHRITRSKKQLKELLETGARGLIVSMIHKFEGMPPNMSTRKNIFVLVDEAHRTTGGDLGNYLMGALPNATYIGFTGTPIDKTSHGSSTFITFGKDDPPQGYLDKYGIAESIDDGTTVKLHYTLAPNDILPDKKVLEEEFLNLAEAQGVSDFETLNKVLEKAVTLKNMLKNQERIKKVAKFAVEHFKEYIEPSGYKAFLVAVDREACALYKKELDKLLPKEYSEVVYSPGHNDSAELAEHHISKEKEKMIRKAFRNPDGLPKILIVTEKLLTGFDAPILYCMYLDKPMRDHMLLQAIARVNRPYEDKTGRNKTCGLVVDFVGIFDKLEKALSFDSSDITGVIDDLELLKGRFKELMKDSKDTHLTIITSKSKDKAVEAILNHFRNEEKRGEFYEFYKEISDIYEILSPDAFLRPYLEDYDTLSRMYRILREAYEPSLAIDRDFARKTAKLVREHTKSGRIESTLETYKIDGNTIKKLEESNKSDIEKIFNLVKSIKATVREESGQRPYLLAIGDRAEMISMLFEKRQKDTQETLDSLKDELENVLKAKKEQLERNMPTEIFSIYWVLKTEGVVNAEKIANEMNNTLEKYPHWKSSELQQRKFKQGLYRAFTTNGMEVSESVKLGNKIIDMLKEVNT